MIARCDAYQKLCKYKYINPKSRQRPLKSSFIKTLFESKSVKNIMFHCLQQLVHIYKCICDIYIYMYIYIYYIYIYIYTYIYIYIYDSQREHHNPCFNLFMLHSNPFDNQGSKINKSDITIKRQTMYYIYIYKTSKTRKLLNSK